MNIQYLKYLNEPANGTSACSERSPSQAKASKHKPPCLVWSREGSRETGSGCPIPQPVPVVDQPLTKVKWACSPTKAAS